MMGIIIAGYLPSVVSLVLIGVHTWFLVKFTFVYGSEYQDGRHHRT